MVLIFSQAFYFNSVYYKFPINLKNKYDVKDEDIPLYMLPLSITSFLSTLLVGQFFDKFGRPKMVLVTCNYSFKIDCLSGILLALTLIANTAM